MANLTLTIDDGLLRSARMKAVMQGTSVNAVVREYLEAWTHGASTQAASVDALLSLARDHAGHLPDDGWTRDELHDR